MLMVELAIVLLLVATNGILAMSEMAVVSSRTSRIKSMIERDVHGSRRALALASDPGRFLSTVQIGISLVGILAGAFSGATIAARLGGWLAGRGVPASFAEPAAFGLVVVAITYVSLIAGELVPKQIALRRPEDIACAIAPGMTVLAKIAFPFVWLLERSSRIVLTALGRRSVPESTVTDEEIRTLVAEAESAGVLEPEERAMISGVLRLGDRPVRAVMTPRHEADMIDLSEDDAAIVRQIKESSHSILPAHEGSPDSVIGILRARDVLEAIAGGGIVNFRTLVRPAPVIPETADALDVVAALREASVHVGLVHDEYGHFQGLVTPVDILEAIVGQFRPADGAPEADLVRRDDGSYLAAGSMPIDELAETLGLTLPETRNYHTLGGFLLTRFGRVPAMGDKVDALGWRFEIVDLDGRRIDRVLATRIGRHRRAAK